MDNRCKYIDENEKVISFQKKKYLGEYSEHDRDIAIKYLANCENPSQFFTANGMIDVPAVIGCINEDMRKKILSEHKYSITQLVSNGKSNGRWQTFLSDSMAKNGRRQIRRTNLKVIGKVKSQSKIKYNDEVILADGLTAQIKANTKKDLPEVNYKLIGWTTQKNGTTVEYTPNEVVKQLKGQTIKDKKIVLYSVREVKLG